MLKKKVVLGCFFALLLALPPLAASAITIDALDGDQAVEAKLNQGPQYSLLSSSTALGGTRAIEGLVTQGSNSFSHLLVVTTAGVLSHSQDNGIAGLSIMSWDGDSSPSSFSPNGLNAFDLLQDGGSAFQFDILAFDFANSNPVALLVTVHDGLDPSRASVGVTYLNAVIPAPGGGVPVPVYIPFSSLTILPGSTGPADLQHIGFITLTVDSQTAPAADLQIDWIGTNGLCANMPDAQGRVIDQCGVCAGDNSTCLDCMGVPNGKALPDRCNVCNGDGMSCLGCEQVDEMPTLAAMDAGAKLQEKQIKYLLKLLLIYDHKDKTKTFAQKTASITHALQVRNWTISWQLPLTKVSCTNTEFCSTSSNVPILTEYRTHNDELLNIANDLIARLKKLGSKAKKLALSFAPTVKKQHDKNLAMTKLVNDLQYSCSAP